MKQIRNYMLFAFCRWWINENTLRLPRRCEMNECGHLLPLMCWTTITNDSDITVLWTASTFLGFAGFHAFNSEGKIGNSPKWKSRKIFICYIHEISKVFAFASENRRRGIPAVGADLGNAFTETNWLRCLDGASATSIGWIGAHGSIEASRFLAQRGCLGSMRFQE